MLLVPAGDQAALALTESGGEPGLLVSESQGRVVFETGMLCDAGSQGLLAAFPDQGNASLHCADSTGRPGSQRAQRGKEGV